MSHLDSPTVLGTSGNEAAAPSSMQRYILILFQKGVDGDPLGELNQSVLRTVQQDLDRVIRTPKNETEIDVWLESPGGEFSAGYKLCLELRSRCDKLRVVVPDHAMGAAMLLAVEAGELWMAAAAGLGPLVAQIDHPDREGMKISALNVARSFRFLGKEALDHVMVGGRSVLNFTGLPERYVLEHLAKFTADLYAPVAAKLDLHVIAEAASAMEEVAAYASAILRAHGRVGTLDCMSPDNFGRHLATGFPSPYFVISREDARMLGLVQHAEKYPFWENLQEYRDHYLDAEDETHEDSHIEVLREEYLPSFESADQDGELNQSSGTGDPIAASAPADGHSADQLGGTEQADA